MPQSNFFSRLFCQSSLFHFSHYNAGSLVLVGIVLGAFCVAQEPSAPPATNPSEASELVVPAGTNIALALTHPIQSRHIHRGDEIYAQIVSPVSSESQVLIPPGTFIQGKLEKIEQKGGRREVHLQSASLVFPNGYVAAISAPLTLRSDEGYALKDPGQRRMVSAFVLPLAGTGLGALIGHAAANSGPQTITTTVPPGCTGGPPACVSSSMTVPGSTLKSTGIGAMVGGAAGGIAAWIMLARSHEFYLDVGSPMEAVLQQPLVLDPDQVAEANARSNGQPLQPVAPHPRPPISTGPATGPFDCPAGQEYCNGNCVDSASFIHDSNNCGRCGNHCSFSESCASGSCSCAAGYTSCNGSCVSQAAFMSDSSNCGRCGNGCRIGESCMGGTCMRTIPCTPGDPSCH